MTNIHGQVRAPSVQSSSFSLSSPCLGRIEEVPHALPPVVAQEAGIRESAPLSLPYSVYLSTCMNISRVLPWYSSLFVTAK